MPLDLMYGVELTVEAALSAATSTYGLWDVAVWDFDDWGPDEVWTDISEFVRSVSTKRAFSRDLQAWEAGTAVIDLNNFDARFSPSNLVGPYAVGGITQIRPWRPIRVTATYAGISYPIFRGYALAWQEYYEQPSPFGGGAYCSVPCVDELGSLARFDGLAQTPVGAGETSGKRLHRILNNAGHTGTRAIDDGHITVQATTLAQNCVTELKLTADSEGGALWIESDGTVTAGDEFSLIEDQRSNTVQVTYGDGGDPEIPYSSIELAYNGDLVANIAAFARVGGTEQVVTDETSRALYKDKRATRTDLICETDAQALGLAQLWIARYAQPEERVTKVQLKPRKDPTRIFPDVLTRRVRDLVTVNRRAPGFHLITNDCHIAGISHNITAANWITDFDLWSAKPWTDFSSSRWDVGLWDTARFFFG